MKILWVTNMWPDQKRPWYGSFVYSQAQSLLQLGVDLDVFYVPGYESDWRYIAAAARMMKRAARERWDIVHAHYGHSAVLSLFQRRAPLVVSYCGDDLLGTPGSTGNATKSSAWLAKGFAQIARLSAATITKSDEMALRLPPSARRRNYVIPNGVDLAVWSPKPRDEARRAVGWNEAGNVALFVGNPANPRKNFRAASDAISLLRGSGVDVTLKVAWEIEPSLLPAFMSAADVLVFPSYLEGSPNTVKEAMAMQLPIVAAPAGDIPERLAGVKGGYVVEREPSMLAAAVEKALAVGRPEELRLAVEPLEMTRVAQRIIHVYDELLQRR